MPNEITNKQASTAAALILAAVLGWMFNKIMDNIDTLGVKQDRMEVRMAVMEEKMSKQERE